MVRPRQCGGAVSELADPTKETDARRDRHEKLHHLQPAHRFEEKQGVVATGKRALPGLLNLQRRIANGDMDGRILYLIALTVLASACDTLSPKRARELAPSALTIF